MHTATHVLIARFFRDNTGIAKDFAHPFGVHEKVPDAWGRPKASDLNPTGTGKGNPLDQAERMIELVHPIDPARAREMAENFVALADELDRQAGLSCAARTNCPRELLAKSIGEHADVSVELISGELSEEKLNRALVEIREAEVALLQLKGCVEGLLKNGEVK